MTGRLLLLAAAGALALPGPASACDPNSFPYCQTHCRAVAYRYEELRDWTRPAPPPWPHTGVAGCP